MRVVREQMLCIISPRWPGGVAAFDAGAPQAPNGPNGPNAHLRALFVDVGVVHFASIALLPPLPGAPAGELPSLLLELAVDEGLRPADLLARLAAHPSGALWAIYQAYFPDRSPASLSQRNAWMLQHMTQCLSVAAGAFVGARDRSVRQIQQERLLYERTREQARLLAAQQTQLRPAERLDRSGWAFALARWAFAQTIVDGSKEAPRSYWRGAAASTGAKVGFFIGVAALIWGLVWALRGVTRGVRWLWLEYFCVQGCALVPPWLREGGLLLSEKAIAALGWVLEAGLRLAGAALIWVLLFWLFWVLLPTLVPAWRHWQDAINRELDRPTQTWSSRLTYLVGLTLLPVLAAAVGGTLVYVAVGAAPFGWVRELAAQIDFHALIAWAIGLGALLLALAIASARHAERRPPPMRVARPRGGLASRWAALSRWFYRPAEDAVPRAQQVHASIERCEAELVDGTAHMISVTELRWPHAWSAWWTRAALRVVTFFGHVVYTEGRLGDAPGIHFGHWHIVNGGRRLIFLSNFDGYFGGYLDDFINGAPSGVNLAWRWTKLLPRPAAVDGHPCVGEERRFPPTRFLVYRGVKCELRFKAYARDSMLPHLFRFDACGLSLDEKRRAAALRDALFGERTDAKDDRIMRAIES